MKKYSVRPSLLFLGLAVGIIANAMINPPFIGPESAAVTTPADTLILKSIVVNGSTVTVDYEKNFAMCGIMMTLDRRIVHTNNVFCINKGPVTVPLTEMNSLFGIGKAVLFCKGTTSLCVQGTVVSGTSAVSSTPASSSSQAASTDTLILKSIVVNGATVTVDYEKNFAMCANILTPDGKIVQINNVFCINKGPVTVSLSQMNSLFGIGRAVLFCKGTNTSLCVQGTVISGGVSVSSVKSSSSSSTPIVDTSSSSKSSSSKSSVPPVTSSVPTTVSSATSSFKTWPNTGVDPLVSIQSCAVPKAAPAHIFYVDPVKGSNTGDGSQAKPWHTLSEVINAKLINGQDTTSGVVHAGDAIYLMSGNHGQLRLQPTVGGGKFNNTDFITIQAAPGQTPIVTGLLAPNVSKWVFKGLTIQLPEDRTAFPDWAGVASMRTANNIVFTDNTVYSAADTTGWIGTGTGATSWYALARKGVTFEGTCGKIMNNTIKNVTFGLSVGGDKVHVDNNTISYYSIDGIDYYISNSAITRNRILDHYPFTDDTYHNDAMQGMAHTALLDNILIDSNTVIESTGTYPNIPLVPTGLVTKDGKNYLQGISEFDGNWAHMTITNNLIVVSAWDAITTMGASDVIIANNTIVKNSSHPEMTPWIRVDTDKAGRVMPVRSIVRNNISPNFYLYQMNGINATYTDHNIVTTPDSPFYKTPLWQRATKALPQDLFVNADITKGPLDLRLKPGSPAIGAGLFLTTPTVDNTGKTRNPASIDIGAYAK